MQCAFSNAILNSELGVILTKFKRFEFGKDVWAGSHDKDKSAILNVRISRLGITMASSLGF